MPEPDPLQSLRDHIRDATAAAQRLVAEDGPIPDAGWAAPQGPRHSEAQALARLLEAIGELLGPELREQLQEVVHQLLILLRTTIDWAIARIEAQRSCGEEPAVEVEDIPIA